MENNNDFLPTDYEAPKGNSNYLKLQKGENKFRILSKPILGWLDWKDKKPLRFKMVNKPEPVDASKPIKHFWAFIIFDYADSKIKIAEFTQSSIQKAIADLSKDEDWGSPFEYDIKINRKGDGMETEYSTNPVPHKNASQEIFDAARKTPLNLEALYEGKDPFEKSSNVTKIELNDMPF